MNEINHGAVSSLLFARVIYAINWFNIASIFSLIALDFKQDVSLLGLLTTSFLIGVGLFQVPGGILAAIQGSRRTAIYGIIMASSAALLCGVSSQLQQMEILRFVVGLGMALFFGSSVTLITKCLGGRGKEGFAVALLNSAHSIGGIIGIFGWIILAEIIGWRQSLLLSGVLGLISSIFLIIFLPRQKESNDKEKEEKQHQKRIQQQIPNKQKHYQIKKSDIRRVLFDKSLFMFGLILLGAQIAWGLSLTFIVFYLEDYIRISPPIAGLIAGLGLISGVISAPIFGRIYDKTKNIGKLLFVCGLLMSAGVAGIAFTTGTSLGLYIVGVSNVLIGVFSAAVFTIAYASSNITYKKGRMEMMKNEDNSIEAKSSFDTLAISWVNGLSLFGAFWVPILFSFVVHHVGYATAWLVGGILSLLFILPSVGIKKYNIKAGINN
jgi:MFS family permease